MGPFVWWQPPPLAGGADARCRSRCLQKKKKLRTEHASHRTHLFPTDGVTNRGTLLPLTVTGCVHEAPRGACDPTRCRETRHPCLCLHGRPPRTCARHVSAGLRRRGAGPRPSTTNVPGQDGKSLATFIPFGPPTPPTATGQPVKRLEFWSEPPVPRLVIRALHDDAVACLRQQGGRQTDKHENGCLAGGLSLQYMAPPLTDGSEPVAVPLFLLCQVPRPFATRRAASHVPPGV